MEETIKCPMKPTSIMDGLPLAGLRLFQFGFVNITGLSVQKLESETSGADAYHDLVVQAKKEWCEKYWTLNNRYIVVVTVTGEVWVKILSDQPFDQMTGRSPDIGGPGWLAIRSAARVGGDFPEELRENFFSGGRKGDELSIKNDPFVRRQQDPLDDKYGSPYPQKIK